MPNHLPIRFLAFLLFCFVCVHSFAQEIVNISAVSREGKVVINYDLRAGNEKQEFDVALYSSTNNYSRALRYVTGNVGKSQLPGKGKEIVWDPKRELTSAFEGEVVFEIRATVLAAPIYFQNPVAGTSLKRGKIHEIQWIGTESTSNLQLEILRNGEPLDTITDVSANSRYSWFIPKKARPGDGYQINLKSGNRSVALSESFRIGGGIPLPVMIGAPVAIAAAAVGIVVLGGETDSSGLPEPPAMNPR